MHSPCIHPAQRSVHPSLHLHTSLPTQPYLAPAAAAPRNPVPGSTDVRRGRCQRCSTAEHAAVSRQPVESGAQHQPTPAPAAEQQQAEHWHWRELQPEGWTANSAEGGSDVAGRVRALFLPAGFPSSVTPDYLEYQLWSLPTHITGWLSHSLTTSTLLQAVGLSAGPLGTTALAAAVKWIAKDGIGAAGRLLVGGKLGIELDDDPRRWRMMSELVTTVGLALEVATSMYPQHFLLLACSGNFAKAIGKGIAKPAFRVIQTHFALANNVGAVSAKEEVWEVFGQLAGLGLSLMTLEVLEDTGSSRFIILVWAMTQGVHVALRQQALSCLAFSTLNHKRACLLVSAHVAGQALPDVATLNRREPLWASPLSLAPSVQLGCSMLELLGSWHPAPLEAPGSAPAWGTLSGPSWCEVHAEVQPFVQLYCREQYMLGWAGGRAAVVLKPGAGPRALLRALWQAAWLHRHGADGNADPAHHHQQQQQHRHHQDTASNGSSSSSSNGDSSSDVRTDGHAAAAAMILRHGREGAGSGDGRFASLAPLSMSLKALQASFDGFESEALSLGWDLNIVNLTVGRLRIDVSGLGEGRPP